MDQGRGAGDRRPQRSALRDERRRDPPIAGHPPAIVIDTIGKMQGPLRLLRRALYRQDRIGADPPSSWAVDLIGHAVIGHNSSACRQGRCHRTPC
jgi:hypothetical protein